MRAGDATERPTAAASVAAAAAAGNHGEVDGADGYQRKIKIRRYCQR
jgi:hypothetical protein